MLKKYSEAFHGFHQAWDICLTAFAFIAAYFIKINFLPESISGLSTEPNYYILLLACLIIWYEVFKFSGVYKPYRNRYFKLIATDVIKSVSVCLLLFALVLFFFKQNAVSRLFVAIFFFIDIVLLILSKWLIYRSLVLIRRKGYNTRNFLIIGCGIKARNLLDRISDRPDSGYKILGCLSTKNQDENTINEGLMPILGSTQEIENILINHIVDELIITEPLRKIENVGQCIDKAKQMGIPVHIMPEWGLREIELTPETSMLRFENAFGYPTLFLTSKRDHLSGIFAKTMIDFLISSAILLICALPFIIIAIAIKLSSKGPIFYKQERVGKNGRRFILFKFRTMVDGADKIKDELLTRNEADGPVFKIRKDPRVIPGVGTFLRKTSLDELPQLINVFKGEMSLVGPRPPLPEEIKEYDIAQRRRLSMKPGLSCIWQTSPRRNDICFNDWIKMDLEYIDNWSLWLDFRILIKTVRVILSGDGR